MISSNLVLIIAQLVFLASAYLLVIRRAAVSPQMLAIGIFLLAGCFMFFPLLRFSSLRGSVLEVRCQVLILMCALSFLASSLIIRRTGTEEELPRVRWRIFSQQTWLILLCMVCVADPILSLALYGNIGIIQANQGMGTGGGNSGEVFSPVTFIAWACGAISVKIITMDFLTGGLPAVVFVRKRFFQLGIVGFSLACNTLSGNRFILGYELLTVLCGLARFSRLQWRVVIPTFAFLAVFFVIIGQFKFGAVDITDYMDSRVMTGVHVIDTPMAWMATYIEPNYWNLDNLLDNQSARQYGTGWLTSILPSSVNDALGLARENSAGYMAENNLQAYHGMTFRTMYGDMVYDFGYWVSALLGLALLLFGAWTYNKAGSSTFHLALFFAISPVIIATPLLSTLYQLQTLATFGIVLLVSRRKKRPRRKAPFQPVSWSEAPAEPETEPIPSET